MTDLAIEAEGLRRVYGAKAKQVEAVKGVTFSVATGEIVGFLGPNGAGKTTTLKMLATLLRPTSGRARVAGHDLAADPIGVRRAIGYVSQSGSTSVDASVATEITAHAGLYGIGAAEAKQRGEELLVALDLAGMWSRKCGALSGGQRRRLDIVMGLITRPKLIFLDEPTTGLDPQARANLWTHIRRLRDEMNTTVFITTHYMDEADSLSDRLLIIDKGEIVAEGTAAALKADLKGDAMTLTFASAKALQTGRALAEGRGAANLVAEGNVLHFQIASGAATLPVLIRELGAAGAEPIGAELSRPTLDDVFLALTGRSLRE